MGRGIGRATGRGGAPHDQRAHRPGMTATSAPCYSPRPLRRGLRHRTPRLAGGGVLDEELAATRERVPEAVLDNMLPDSSGHDICRSRCAGRLSRGDPFLKLAKDEVGDRVGGLAVGADDYIVKPFVFDELLARLRVHLQRRRAAARTRTLVTARRLSLDLATQQGPLRRRHPRPPDPARGRVAGDLMEQASRPVARG
ncbi:hypothetical protein ACU4GD_21530, partial [Cupriavidus basilensis]